MDAVKRKSSPKVEELNVVSSSDEEISFVEPTFLSKLQDVPEAAILPGVDGKPDTVIRDLLYAPREAPPISVASCKVPSFTH